MNFCVWSFRFQQLFSSDRANHIYWVLILVDDFRNCSLSSYPNQTTDSWNHLHLYREIYGIAGNADIDRQAAAIFRSSDHHQIIIISFRLRQLKQVLALHICLYLFFFFGRFWNRTIIMRVFLYIIGTGSLLVLVALTKSSVIDLLNRLDRSSMVFVAGLDSENYTFRAALSSKYKNDKPIWQELRQVGP